MRDPYRKKQRDLRRKLKSCHRPSGGKLFAQYFPELSDRDPNTGQIDWEKWIPGSFSHQERDWKLRICDYEPYWMSAPPAWYRRDHNRQLRTRQKAAVNKAAREDDWDSFILPRGRHNIRWLWW